MDNRMTSNENEQGYADLFALGFGTTVGMWLAGYLCRLPAVMLPSQLVLALMLLILLAGGYLSGRLTSRGWRGGVYTALTAALLNLLILGSLLSGDSPNQVHPAALLWLPGWFLLAAALGLAGGVIGARKRLASVHTDWTGLLVVVGVAATFLLIIVGGLVTSNDAGLAVVDWPNSFGYNMFLYPLSRMTGGIYYEHAHRLFGSLVGITTLVITFHLFRVDQRKWVKNFSLLVLAVVIVQGILGGLRVTGKFTLATSPEEVAPSLTLALVHGVLGQFFLGLMTVLAVVASNVWKKGRVPAVSGSRSIDRWLSGGMIFLVLFQVILGALQRHFAMGLTYHILVASIVVMLAITITVRANAFYSGQHLIQRFGRWLSVVSGLQILLGLGALIATLLHVQGEPYAAWETLIPTSHQAVGAILFSVSVGLWTWLWCETASGS